MAFLQTNYLGREVLEGFDRYRYSCRDTSPLSNYIMHPFWNKAVLLCPKWVAPNLLTLVGFICCICHYLLPTYYDYSFTASAYNSDHPIPSWTWGLIAFMLFLSHTLDGIDGKQARRTGTSSPLGELFDHGCDAWATVFITTTFYSLFGRDEDGYSVPIDRMYLVLWNVFLCFHISHWEKYNTGVMYLPWGYDLAMVGGTILYTITAIKGHMLWKFRLPGGHSAGPFLEFSLYLGSAGLALPAALRNIYRSYKDGTGKMRPFAEATRPLVSFFAALVICVLWAYLSPNSVMHRDIRAFFYMSGTLYANISCRLIVAQMSDTRCELFNLLLVPLLAAVATALIIPGLPLATELVMLYLLCCGFTVAHLHYGCCVVAQMARHLKIDVFRIKSHGEIRLLNSSISEPLLMGDEDENAIEVVVMDNKKNNSGVAVQA